MKRKNLIIAITLLLVTALLLTGCGEKKDTSAKNAQQIKVQNQEQTSNSESAITEGLSEFDLSFLKMENGQKNKIYSPLSIKYALKMLEEGTVGNAKIQISSLIGNYSLTKYNSNSNMSLANAMFIRDSFKDSVKEDYINTLKNKYDAEVKFDSFDDVKNINSWISKKTLDLIPSLLEEIDPDENFFLVNALGIDMEWNEKFTYPSGGKEWRYAHEDFYGRAPVQVSKSTFDTDQEVSGMRIEASINNYDVMKEIGEDEVRRRVGEAFKEWAKGLEPEDWEYDNTFNGDLSDENIEKALQKYLDGSSEENDPGYIEEISANYGKCDYSTEFSFYIDDDVKAFSKDLKEYDGTVLQYIGIMPTSKSLDKFIEGTDETKITNIVNNMKELKNENFKQGVLTHITGYIPKFKFEYDLDLESDLKELGVKDVFEQDKANLDNITTDKSTFISKALHKANIEFTQDGIKAAAVTIFGGAGAGESFDYIINPPIEEIDLTFDKPYMFIIRDKETGEVWFAGTVYEPLSWENEPERDNHD